MPPRQTWLPWLGLALASSPAIASLARQLLVETPHRYTLLALLLTGLALAFGPEAESETSVAAARGRRPLGWLALAFGFAAQLVGVAASSGFLANVGIPLALIGVGLIVGRPRIDVLLLTLGLIPIPGFLLAMGSPTVESHLGEGLASLFAVAGWPVEGGGPLLTRAGRRFELFTADAGLISAHCGAVFGWYRSVRAGGTMGEHARSAGVGALVALALQPLLLLACGATLALGCPDLGRFVLSHGVPLALGFAALAIEARRRLGDREAVLDRATR